jgi:tripartite-type tricarboxylate transporter receptor subunit TctC
MKLARIGRIALAAALALGIALPASAQTDWPKGPVRVVVPFPPGGANDAVARPYAEQLTRLLGQPFVVENRAGAGGSVGLESVIRSKPDGYTLCMCASTVISSTSNLRKVSYKAEDIDAIAITTMYLSGLMISNQMPVKNFQEFMAYVKANPGKVTYGSSGVGSPGELRTKYLDLLAGTRMTHVPYNGNAQALTDLLAGTIDSLIEVNGFPHVKAGRLKLIAMFTEQRHPDFPDIPTINELGYAQANTPIWQGFYGPMGIPEEIRAKLHKTVAEISEQPELKARLLTMGFATRTIPLAEMRKFYLDDDALHKKIIREANIKID